MLAAGFVFAHRDWAPGRKSDIDVASLEADRDWAPGGAPEEDDMFTDDDRRMLKNVYGQTAHLDTAGMGALARIDAAIRAQSTADLGALVKQMIAEFRTAGVERGKESAAVLTALTGFTSADPAALAAALAPLLHHQNVDLDEETLVRAARLDIAARLGEPAVA